MFWCIQPLAFVLEGVVQYQWKMYRKGMLWWMNGKFVAAFERMVGYMWVVGWLMWCAPKADFAFQQCRA